MCTFTGMRKEHLQPFFRLFAFVLLIQLALTFIAVERGALYTNDSAEYSMQAENLLNDGSRYCGDYSAKIDPSLYSRRPPGYAIFLLLSSLALQFSTLTLFFQAILHALTASICWLILAEAFGIRLKTGVALALWTLMPSSWIYAHVFMSETLLQFLLVLSLYLVYKAASTKQIVYFWLVHLFLALLYLTKPVGLACWIIVLCWQAWRMKPRSVKPVLLAATMHMLIIAGVVSLNHKNTGVHEYSSVGRKLLINYTIPAVLSEETGKDSAFGKIRVFQKSLEGLSYPKQCSLTDNYISYTILEQPAAVVTAYLKGVFHFLTDAGRWDLDLAAGNTGELPSFSKDGIAETLASRSPWYWFFALWTFAGAMGLIVLACVGLNRKMPDSGFRLLFVAIVCWFMFATGPSASARFRVPVFPLIVMLAVPGLVKLAPRFADELPLKPC